MNLSHLHGNLQRLAFLVLFPIGGAIAMFRHKIGPGWLRYHVFFQVTATLVVFFAAGIQVYKWSQKKKIEYTEGGEEGAEPVKRAIPPMLMAHIVLGSMVGILLIIQLLWAFFARRYIAWHVWYYIHVTLAVFILAGGLGNLFIGYKVAHG